MFRHKFIAIIFSLITLILFPIVLLAYNPVQARSAFLAALSDLQHHNQAGFLAITENLRDYPLYPYLLYSDLTLHMDVASPEQLQGFLEAYHDTPLADHLRHLWLTQLAARHQWRLFIAIYQPTKLVGLQCANREALWETGQQQQALQDFDKILGKNTSLPDACLFVFAQALHQGNIAKNLLWDRIELAFKNHNPALAEQLADLLPKKDRALFKLWEKVYNNPKLILKIPGLTSPIALTGLQRFSEENPHQSALAWDAVIKKNNFDTDTQQQALKIVALALAHAHDPSASAWLISVPVKYTDAAVRAWRIRAALYSQNWPLVQASITTLPPDEQKLSQWRYWLARSMAAQDNVSQAQNIYRDLSLHGDFYGQLASVQLNEQPLMAIADLKVDSAQIAAIATIPAMQRSYELYQLKWLPEATQEWQWAIQHMPEEDYLAAAELAIQWGWFERAIDTVNLISDGSNIPLRFPLAYRDPIFSSALKNNLDPAWVFALVRQESLFMPEVKSSAGALGLMQLMPNTALLVANSIHMPFTQSNLLNPQMNLDLGSVYLKQMLGGFKNNMILATAAYNAGPGNVKKWILKVGMPADIWIETIPFHETRDYVKNIMGSMTFYEKELTLPETLTTRMRNPI
ncbi:MAG TPA: transglycosylase SLT domain-containing protein [Gammaproteobacteria bacterium]|nr:transglycosylase SLT domain-containing protein [Gammaproteobacteria bacterium]